MNNDSSVVKLIIALLDDNHGITEEAFGLLKDTVIVMLNDRSGLPHAEAEHIERILSQVETSEGRVFLPEGVT